MKEEHKSWHSSVLNRNFEMLIFGHAGFPVIVFPTSQGRFYQNKDFSLIGSVAHLVDAGHVKIYTPDGIDNESWYNYSIHPADRVRRHILYERVILEEVVPFARYETGSDRIAAAGCSFGGYHAANLAFRHPDLVRYLISMSGAFDIKQFIMGYYDDNCYFNNPPDYLPGVDESEYLNNLRRLGIVLGVGDNDFCFADNHRLSDILNGKQISHWLDIRHGAHDWPLWREMFPAYLWRMLQMEGRVQ
jgi:esterase/lipase superfamily enzyme